MNLVLQAHLVVQVRLAHLPLLRNLVVLVVHLVQVPLLVVLLLVVLRLQVLVLHLVQVHLQVHLPHLAQRIIIA